MGSCSQLKREFVKKWAKGLETYSSSDKKMSFLERKKAIKLSADLAMASSRINSCTSTSLSSTSWSFVLIAKAKMDDNNVALIDNIVSPYELQKCSSSQLVMCHKRIRSKKILERSYGIRKRARKMAPKKKTTKVLAIRVAKRLVKKRTKMLKTLVPGGESMDEICLIKEALDYIISLRAQVDVMRHLANATDQVLNCKKMIDHCAKAN